MLIVTTWKVSVFRVLLVHIFPHSDWIRRYTLYLSLFRKVKFGLFALLAKMYLGACQTSMMALFMKKLTALKSSIVDIWLGLFKIRIELVSSKISNILVKSNVKFFISSIFQEETLLLVNYKPNNQFEFRLHVGNTMFRFDI